MSCDWNIKCVDCNDVHYFNDANHKSREMLVLIKHADSIAAIADLQAESDFELNWSYGQYGRVDAKWFKHHLGHNLMPVDEYGQLIDQCHENAICGECKTSHKCVLKVGHEGPHARSA